MKIKLTDGHLLTPRQAACFYLMNIIGQAVVAINENFEPFETLTDEEIILVGHELKKLTNPIINNCAHTYRQDPDPL